MIEAVRKGDLFQSGAQTLVNTVNTVGVMGKGIALAVILALGGFAFWFVRRRAG